MDEFSKEFLEKLSELMRAYRATISYFDNEDGINGDMSIHLKPDLRIAGIHHDIKNRDFLDSYQIVDYVEKEEQRIKKDKEHAIQDEWAGPVRTDN